MDRKAPLVIYHANCADGFGAAWAIWRKHPDWEFYPGVYNAPPPDVASRDVWLVDFSYKRAVIEEMLERALSVNVLDHHKSAIEDLAGIAHDQFFPVFRNDMSGALIAWHAFNIEEPPMLLRHIEDRDLWRFNLTGTREICAGLFSYPYDFHVWDKLMKGNLLELQAEGRAIERMNRKNVESLVKTNRRMMYIGERLVPVVNAPGFMASDIGNMLSEGYPFAATYYDTSSARHFSLRSRIDGIDVSKIAAQYGGGGHANAAGFSVPREHSLAEE